MSQHARRQLTVVLAGAASLAIAMGVGRFAFTPILPMMLHDGVLDLQVAGNLATANYIGYLVGALASMLVPKKWDHTTVIRLALVTTVILTCSDGLARTIHVDLTQVLGRRCVGRRLRIHVRLVSGGAVRDFRLYRERDLHGTRRGNRAFRRRCELHECRRPYWAVGMGDLCGNVRNHERPDLGGIWEANQIGRAFLRGNRAGCVRQSTRR